MTHPKPLALERRHPAADQTTRRSAPPNIERPAAKRRTDKTISTRWSSTPSRTPPQSGAPIKQTPNRWSRGGGVLAADHPGGTKCRLTLWNPNPTHQPPRTKTPTRWSSNPLTA